MQYNGLRYLYVIFATNEMNFTNKCNHYILIRVIRAICVQKISYSF